MDKNVKVLQELISKSNRIVFFGGAGVSTESGIKDFRSKDGLYNLQSKYGQPYEVMLSHSYFEEHTETFYKFYREFMIVRGVKPNNAHKYLAKLEKKKDLTVITQNIDGLHQLAGSNNVIELHGTIHHNICTKCGRQYSLEDIEKMDNVPLCPVCHGVIKPDVVLYEEPLNERAIMMAIDKIRRADLLIVAGTSLSVYPAAGLIHYFNGKHIVVINKEKLPIYEEVSLEITRPVGEVFGELLNDKE